MENLPQGQTGKTDGDHVHRVQPDDGEFGVMLLLGRSLTALHDVPFIVESR